MIEESTGTLLCGDLFTQLGNGPAMTQGDIVGPAIAAEDLFKYSALNPGHGRDHPRPGEAHAAHARADARPVFLGRCAAALRALAEDYERRTTSRRMAIAENQAA